MTKEAYGGLKHALSAHPGALHRALHVPEGKKIPASELARARKSKNPHMRKMAALATTASHFKH